MNVNLSKGQKISLDKEAGSRLNKIVMGLGRGFTVNSFTGQDFSQIENATCRLLDGSTQHEVARFNLSTLGKHTAQIANRSAYLITDLP